MTKEQLIKEQVCKVCGCSDKQNTMTLLEAKQKAKNGGYQDIGQNEHHLKDGQIVDCYYKMLLDPLFFQALGKSMGWGRVCGALHECYLHCEYQGADKGEWLYHWHRLIDHLAEGKSIEDYFKNL